jgi:hypothetical protein
VLTTWKETITMHHHLIAAQATAITPATAKLGWTTAITPATATLIRWGIVILAVLYLLNSVFGKSSN